MAENKKSFILYADQIDSFESLTDKEAGQLIKHIYRYVNDKNPAAPNKIVKIAFEPIKNQMKRDLKEWERKLEKRSEAGKIGGAKSAEARRSKLKQNEAIVGFDSKNEANEAVTVNDNVTVTDNVILNTGENFLIPSMCQVWYSKFAHYTKNQDNDFPAMLKILKFMTSQAGQTNINDPTVKETILNTLEQIADEVSKDSFWLNKPINSIANNIQEFYNKIKNPQNGSHKHASKQATNKQSIDYLLQSIGSDIQRAGEKSNRA